MHLPTHSKQERRIQALTARQLLLAAERQKKSQRVVDQLKNSFDWSSFHYIHLYLPLHEKAEVDILPLWHYLWEMHPNLLTLTNQLEESKHLRCVPYQKNTPLKKNCFGIDEPITHEYIDPLYIDAMIIPLLACDAKGYRLGYGKGYYDKLLQQCRKDLLKIGVNYFSPSQEFFLHEAHDIALDRLVTPEEIFSFETN